jgi:hypothetical protein
MLSPRLSRLIEEQCILLEKVSLAEKQHGGLVPSLKDGTKFYRKLVVKARNRRDTGKNPSKAEEKIIHATEELDTYKKVARERQEKLKRTNHYYQRQRKKLILTG